MATDFGKCQDVMRSWEQKGEEPVNFDVLVLNRLQELEQEEQRKQRTLEATTGCDARQAAQGRLEELRGLCEYFGMADFEKNKATMSDQQLVEQFTYGVDGAFHAYKENSTINRALLKCKLKERMLTTTE